MSDVVERHLLSEHQVTTGTVDDDEARAIHRDQHPHFGHAGSCAEAGCSWAGTGSREYGPEPPVGTATLACGHEPVTAPQWREKLWCVTCASFIRVASWEPLE